MQEKEIWIVAAKRTPMGRFQGMLSEYSSPKLGAVAIKAAMEEQSLSPDLVDEVYMGCVLPAGCGQAPARQAALGADLPKAVGCTTINKVCGSGMKAVMLANDLIRAGSANCIVAGGMESMTNAPYLLKESRSGMRMGHKSTYDHMFLDGLQDAYEGELMGVFGQQIADKLEFTREQMDEWATLSVNRAIEAQQQDLFADEIVPVTLKKDPPLDYDEQPRSIKPEKIPQLRPAFAKDGSITAANSSAISDGAAALVVMDAQTAKQQGLEPLAIIKGHATHARIPAEFTLAPVYAIEQLLSQLDWAVDEVDLWEINEAFAVVTQIAVKQLSLDSEKVNVKGGACALGHPIGASGARILVTLIHSLRQLQALGTDGNQNNKRVVRGVASLCIGGGEATAMGIEIPL
ncbi:MULTISPECIES: acetyl-CoA C-acyltransferase [Vibrio]|uniref:acetyl-CoA C-acyltransferase n=1 Tax=Vibrio TaxID=662 RepID=UPI0001B95880|nr:MULTISPECIES: acetyl-CoA C-acyltransferase [Vibrio]EEX33423.1 3-ketoacyl-CoA thiolase [isoleucine degradation] [Vibrio coralliilyticus ATCC BAA-450]MCM5508329.1 acetyl-CoA C-acyltransferase [Vibrio sp. SCSIO 43169]MDE3897035.1 acetyl-CoA C-acyltransferase [Vibrio sp. CC007]QFT38280.1 Acetyl-CoA acetyltransferase [Vibrio sp. THAF64]QGM37182.1 Acetyl-CoA acetyltransferase [Vibrio sp. THAF191d]